MKTIHKISLLIEDVRTYDLPEGAVILSVAEQHKQLMMWYMFDHQSASRVTPRQIRIYGTGHQIDQENLVFIGTALMFNGSIVYHVFEKVG